jgi:hypothetical protein
MRSLRRTVQTAAVLAFASSSATGCFKATLSDARFARERHEVWVDQYVFGLVGSPELDVREFCGDGAARVGFFENAWAVSSTLLSLGLYTPRVATIACAGPRSRSPSGPRPSR